MKNVIFFIVLMVYTLPVVSQNLEKPLNLFGNQIGVKQYRSMSKDFKNSFTYTNTPVFNDYVFEGTSYSYLLELQRHLPEAPQDTFIRMLRIFYGFDTTRNKIQLIYFPDYAVRQSITTYAYMKGETPTATDTVYLCNPNGSFSPFLYNSDTISRLIYGYRQSGKLKFRDMASGGVRPVTFSNTESSDAKQVAFPLQEIEGFFKDSATILFTSIARTIEIDGVNPIKHCIALTGIYPQNITDNANVAADLGSLCPIRCGDLYLTYYHDFNRAGVIYKGGWGTESKFIPGQRFFLLDKRNKKFEILINKHGNEFHVRPAGS